MKLLNSEVRCRTSDRGNVKTAAVMGDTGMDRFSDRGSIPLSSTLKKCGAGLRRGKAESGVCQALFFIFVRIYEKHDYLVMIRFFIHSRSSSLYPPVLTPIALRYT